MLLSMSALLVLYLLLTASIEIPINKTQIAFLVLELILLFAFKVSGYFASGRSLMAIVLGALIVICILIEFSFCTKCAGYPAFAAFWASRVWVTMVALILVVYSLCYWCS